MEKIRILLADDHQMVREALRRLIHTQPDMEVIAECDDGLIAVQLAAELTPHIAILDIEMPNLNGIGATAQIVSETPETQIIALTAHADRWSADRTLKAGASAYLSKVSAFSEVIAAIRSVMAGKIHVNSFVRASQVGSCQNLKQSCEAGKFYNLQQLSFREKQILQLFADGRATKQLAAVLHLSVKTVETHRRNIMQKLDLFSIAELTKYAIRERMVSL